NIRSMALAQLWFGQGRGLQNFVSLGIRTGIAAGIVAGGHLLHGDGNLAGEIGGWLCPVAPITRCPGQNGDSAWNCQQLRPLEQIASVPAIIRAIQTELDSGRPTRLEKKSALTFEDIAEAAQAGDEGIGKILADVAQTLGWVLCQINSLCNPQKIIIAGPLVTLGETFLVSLRQAVTTFCDQLHQQAPQVVHSELGNFNGALGAAALALHRWKPKR